MTEFGEKEEGITYTERLGAYGILLDGDKVLLEKTYLGYFIPGGGLEPGELHEEALRREYLEETGYEVTPVRALGEVAQYVFVPHSKRYLKKLATFFLVEGFQKFPEPVQPDKDPDGTQHPTVWLSVEEAISSLYLEAESWALEQLSGT